MSLPSYTKWEEILLRESKIEKLYGGFQFVEGPVWTKRNSLIFSDTDGDTLYEFFEKDKRLEVFRRPANFPNGNALDIEQRLITCHHGSRNITRTEHDGTIIEIASHYNGHKLNSPNDIITRSNGEIYFTDPPYGISQEQEEQGFNGVYRIDIHGNLTKIIHNDLVRPNGLAFSLDEKILYVTYSEAAFVLAFDVTDDGRFVNRRIFADMHLEMPGITDGMCLDERGNLYVTGPGGVQVFSPEGTRIGVILVPEWAANCAWGGEDAKTLYITARTGLYRIRLGIKGIRSI